MKNLMLVAMLSMVCSSVVFAEVTQTDDESAVVDRSPAVPAGEEEVPAVPTA